MCRARRTCRPAKRWRAWKSCGCAAAYNYNVFLAAIVGFARERGVAGDGFFAWTAARLGDTWSGLLGHGADAVLRLVLENLASTGYAVEQADLGAAISRAAVRTVPLGLDDDQWRSLLAPFGATPADMLELFQVFVPLAASAGAELEMEQHAGLIRLTMKRTSPGVGPQPVTFLDG